MGLFNRLIHFTQQSHRPSQNNYNLPVRFCRQANWSPEHGGKRLPVAILLRGRARIGSSPVAARIWIVDLLTPTQPSCPLCHCPLSLPFHLAVWADSDESGYGFVTAADHPWILKISLYKERAFPPGEAVCLLPSPFGESHALWDSFIYGQWGLHCLLLS